jgi:rfaE bifunctional protein kinase chain/domain
LNKQEIQKLFNDFTKVKALVIGDIMLDSYIIGTAHRISPEAPVPVVNVHKKENRPGGAANVAINLKALGAHVSICAVVGADENGSVLSSSLQNAGIITDGIFVDTTRGTTCKTRIIANNHQMLRVDNESCSPVTQIILEQLLKFIETKITGKQYDIIVFEDYDKGLLNENFINSVIAKANHFNIPVVVDPKKDNFFYYKNVSLFKPNLKELNEGMGLNIQKNDICGLGEAIQELNKKLNANMIMLTLSENGVLLHESKNTLHFKAHPRQIADVSGAGDTVISVAALCVALNLKSALIAELANIAGGLVCEKSGVVPVNKDELLEESLRLINIQ